MIKSFTITETTHLDGGDIGDYWVRRYTSVDRTYSSTSSTRHKPDAAWEEAKRLLAEGWKPRDSDTAEWCRGMRIVDLAFEEDAKHAHLYDSNGRLR